MKHCVVTIGSAKNGLFQKRTKQGELRTYQKKQSFTPRNPIKLCITPSEILRTKSKTPGNNCISMYCISGHTIPNNLTFLFCRHDWMIPTVLPPTCLEMVIKLYCIETESPLKNKERLI